jgi:hypothetical protein
MTRGVDRRPLVDVLIFERAAPTGARLHPPRPTIPTPTFSRLERYAMGLSPAGANLSTTRSIHWSDVLACIRSRDWIGHYRPQQLGHHLEEPKLSRMLSRTYLVMRE